MRIANALMIAIAVFLSSFSGNALAHCDTLDGPVVEAARVALETGNIDAVLIWVQAEHETEVRSAFNRSIEVRALGDAANELADTYFFETVVRLHREGEGAPYTGLKPAGTDFGPAIPAADLAVESASLDDVIELLTGTLRAGLDEHFDEVLSEKDFESSDVAAGRMYVASYVEYIHYVERIYDAATSPAEHHFPEHD